VPRGIALLICGKSPALPSQEPSAMPGRGGGGGLPMQASMAGCPQPGLVPPPLVKEEGRPGL